MQNEIKKIYQTLSGGKVIENDNYIISSKQFNSISSDRFISELKKLGIIWDGSEIIFSDLVNGNLKGNTKNHSEKSIKREVTSETTNNIKMNFPDNVGIDIQEINELPDVATYVTTNLNLSLFGSAQFNVKSQFTEENPMIVSTSMASIVIKSGKFIIRSEENSLLLIVLEGEATVLDSLSKHKQTVKDKNMLVVVPAPKLQGRAAEHIKKQNMFSLKSLDDVDNKELTTELTALSDVQSNIKFIVINKDVVGVKIR
jgi:hypothetical protein